MNLVRVTSVRVLLACVLPLLTAPSSARAADWKPIDAAQLSLKAPRVQADADAEALFWEVRVADELDQTSDLGARTVFDHYVRIKIFTDRGRDAYATVDLPYETGIRKLHAPDMRLSLLNPSSPTKRFSSGCLRGSQSTNCRRRPCFRNRSGDIPSPTPRPTA